jgi:hypothetical protein
MIESMVSMSSRFLIAAILLKDLVSEYLTNLLGTPNIVRVISKKTADAVTYLLKAGKELNERHERTYVSKVAHAKHLRVEYLTSFADFPHHFGVGNQNPKECD